MLRGGIAIGGGLVVLAIAASPALATTDRVDYDAQVNPICASANTRAKQLYDEFEALAKRLPNSGSGSASSTGPKRNKKESKLQRRVERLFSQLPFQVQAIYDTELAQLKQVASAPGDEPLVSTWLANRQTMQDLNKQFNVLEARIERLFNREFKRRIIRSFEKLERKENRLQKKADAIYARLEPLRNGDVQLGTQLGATYCVTDATGTP